MNIDILKIEDTDDGGAIITVEVTQDVLHLALQVFLTRAIGDAIKETFIETATREMVEEDELPAESDQSTEEYIDLEKWREAIRDLAEDEETESNER